MNMKTTTNTLMNDIKTNTPSFFTMKAKMTTTTMILKSFMVITSICSVYLSGIGFRCHNSIEDGDSYTHSPLEQLKRSNNKHDPLSPRRSPISEIYVLSLLESKANIFEQRNTFDSDENDDDEIDDDDDDDDNEVETGLSKTSNSNSNSNSRDTVQWFQSYNGMNQTILNDYSQLTGLGILNVTQFETMTTQEHKNLYASPHVVGCYLSHWRVLEKVWKDWKLPKSSSLSLSRPSQTIKKNKEKKKKKQERKKIQKRPDMLFIFEDDALCISNVIQHTWNVVQKLPVDWDILYIGGKPISYYTDGKTLSDYITMEPPTPEQWKNDSMRPSDSEFKQQLCNPTNKNQFGKKSTSGPYPIYNNNTTGTSNNSKRESPIYYEIKNILNTHSYVINPKRINRILRVLAKPQYEYKPIDVVLQEDMFREFYNPLSISSSQASTENSTTNSSSSSSSSSTTSSSTSSSSAPLKAYLTPYMYCDQDAKRVIVDRDNPTGTDWEGYYWLPWRLHKGFPDSTGYMWSTMGSTR